MEKKLSNVGILRDITSMREFAKKLIGKGKDYDELLWVITDKDYYDDDNMFLLNLKELQSKVNKLYSFICKQLNEIYNDLQKHEEIGIEFSIKKVEYVFLLHNRDNYGWFVLDDLPILPRVGEQIDIPFLREKMGQTYYYVENIFHHISDSKQTINITLNPGSPNLYFRIRKDEAYLKGEINREEYNSKEDWDIREKLKLRRY